MKENKNDKAITKVEKQDGKAKKAFNKFLDVLSKKWLVNLSTTILLMAIIIAIYLGVTILLDKVTLPELDCTTGKTNSLSEETKSKVGAMDKDITITLINYQNEEKVKGLIEKYREINKKIEIEEIDNLVSRTDLMITYGLSTDSSLVIVSSEGRETVLTEDNFYSLDYNTYQQIDTTEEAITNALVDVTTEKKPKIYFMTNHAAYSLSGFSTIMKKIETDANEVEEVDLLTKGKVPDDCDCLVITTLKEDILDSERDMIISYINNGGKLLLLCGTNTSDVNLTNFNKVLDIYGIKFENGIVFEGEESNMLYGYPDIIIENMSANSTTKNINSTIKAAFIDAAPITLTTDEEKLDELGVEYETLITTSDKAFVRTNLLINSEGRTSADSEEGEYTVGVLATKTVDDKTSKLILYSDEIFAMDMPVQIEGTTQYTINLYNNKDIVANAVSYLNEREDTITIREKAEIATYTVTESQHNVIMAIIFITPVVIIIAGIVVWILRRKSK